MNTSKKVLVAARRRGWSDAQLGKVAKVSEETVRRTRVSESREMGWASLWRIYKRVIVGKAKPPKKS